MIREHEVIVLARDLAEFSLKVGDLGTVVHLYPDGAYEVEFVTLEGMTVAVATLEKNQVRPIGPREIHHARLLESSP